MPLSRFFRLPQEKQRLILSEARAEFARHGYEGASFNRIITASGISKGAMYYYFADKADLYSAVLCELYELTMGVLDGLPAIHSAADYWDVLGLGMERLQNAFLADEEMGALVRGMYGAGSSAPGFVELMERFANAVEELITLGQDVGAVRDDLPRPLLAQLTASVVVAIDRWLAHESAHTPAEELAPLMPRVMTLLQDLLRPHAEKQR